MTEDTDTETKTAEPSSLLARHIWTDSFKAANPNASDEEVKALSQSRANLKVQSYPIIW